MSIFRRSKPPPPPDVSRMTRKELKESIKNRPTTTADVLRYADFVEEAFDRLRTCEFECDDEEESEKRGSSDPPEMVC